MGKGSEAKSIHDFGKDIRRVSPGLRRKSNENSSVLQSPLLSFAFANQGLRVWLNSSLKFPVSDDLGSQVIYST